MLAAQAARATAGEIGDIRVLAAVSTIILAMWVMLQPWRMRDLERRQRDLEHWREGQERVFGQFNAGLTTAQQGGPAAEDQGVITMSATAAARRRNWRPGAVIAALSGWRALRRKTAASVAVAGAGALAAGAFVMLPLVTGTAPAHAGAIPAARPQHHRVRVPAVTAPAPDRRRARRRRHAPPPPPPGGTVTGTPVHGQPPHQPGQPPAPQPSPLPVQLPPVPLPGPVQKITQPVLSTVGGVLGGAGNLAGTVLNGAGGAAGQLAGTAGDAVGTVTGTAGNVVTGAGQAAGGLLKGTGL
jgi:hypothetical protein